MVPPIGKGPECEHVSSLLSPYLDGRLTPSEMAQVRAHLEACPTCADELRSLRETVVLLRSLPVLPVPRQFTLAVLPAPVFSRWFFFLRAATAGIATCLIAVLISMTVLLGGTPADGTIGPTADRPLAKASRGMETPVAGAPQRSTSVPEVMLSSQPTPPLVPTRTPMAGLIIQPASAPPEDPEGTPTSEGRAVPVARATITGKVAQSGGSAMWPLQEIALGLFGGLLALGSATGIVWWQERRRRF